ncbi:odorant receptor Or2 [Papilio machaon]|uniref:odorant receptor Or2 n=1 Tax=Papilio machaon TaxID=76193 RepID=UPI001E664CAC|nr:odorant receptor Or2 [Papilio machaon]
MLKRLLDKLESERMPLLGPNVKALKFWGLLLPKEMLPRNLYILMHLLVIIFTATEYVDIWFIKSDINLLLNNLKITMLATVSVIKVMTFLFWQKHWKSIIQYVNKADLVQRITDNRIKKLTIEKYTRYCRRITYLYWALMYTTVIIVMVQPIYKYAALPTYRELVRNGTQSYMQVVSSWVPFNKNTIPGHITASFIQSFASIYGGGWITSFDTNAMVIMVFFKGELELLKIDCGDIFGTASNPVSDNVANIRLHNCHKRYVELIKYIRLFDSCLSPIMLLYMFVSSVMLCATAYQITVETSAMQRFLTTEYLIFGVAQLFIYCWHSNDLFYASRQVMNGPYNSMWWNRNKYCQKDIQILIGQFNKTIVFSAGPFTDLTVATFINILKGAYSYYTLLQQSQETTVSK